MESRYVDPYVSCPFYVYDEASTARKIHCEGYTKGIHVHLYFKDKKLKKAHKAKFCKDPTGYQKCPICQGNFRHCKEEGNE